MISDQLLVVEDVRRTVQGLLLRLQAEHWNVDLAEDVLTAEMKLPEMPYRFMLLDWRLPRQAGGDIIEDAGDSLLEKLKSGGYGSLNEKIPFAVLTTVGVFVDEVKVARYQGYQGIFFKAGDIRHLLSAVNRFRLGRPAKGEPLPRHRSVWRTLVEIVAIKVGARAYSVEAIVPGWDPNCIVHLSASQLPPHVLRQVRHKRLPLWILASANLAATSEEDLELEAFELAPPPAREEDVG